MYGISLQSGQVILEKELPIPELQNGQALIKVCKAGICSTDLALINGYADFAGVFGHEFVGIVQQVADFSQQHWVGKRVTGEINIACGKCQMCKQQIPEHCNDRQVLGIRSKQGCFAEFITLPITNLHQVPESISDNVAVLTEPFAAACRILQQVNFTVDSQLAVVGCGRLGMLIGAALHLDGRKVTMLARQQQSLELPKAWGLSVGLVHQQENNSFDIIVDASGQVSGLQQALRMLRPRGQLVLKSTFLEKTAVDLSQLVVSEITLIGSRCGPFDKALELLNGDTVAFTSLIDAVFPLKNGLQAITHAEQKGVRKVLLEM